MQIAAVAMLALAACGGPSGSGGNDALPQGAFWDGLEPACGQVLPGEMLSRRSADRDWRRRGVSLDLVECSREGIRMVLAVGDDRSRSWTLTPQDDGILFRIERAEGTGPGVSGYGGLSTEGPDAMRQVFPADAVTKEMFAERNLVLALENVWSLTLDPEAGHLTYEVERISGGRKMRFDLNGAVAHASGDGSESGNSAAGQ